MFPLGLPPRAHQKLCLAPFRAVSESVFPRPHGYRGHQGRAVAEVRRRGFESTSGRVGFVVGKAALGQVFSEYFSLPCQFSFHRLRSHHPGLVQRQIRMRPVQSAKACS
jgi:hypothetical protein